MKEAPNKIPNREPSINLGLFKPDEDDVNVDGFDNFLAALSQTPY